MLCSKLALTGRRTQRAVKFTSDARIRPQWTGRAGAPVWPWRMMNEWGIAYCLHSGLLVKYLGKLAARSYVPPVAIAGALPGRPSI